MAWEHLKRLFNDLIRALHARHTHARECVIGCDRCRVADEAARKAREAYDAGLREYIG